jgi:hypothetical protein
MTVAELYAHVRYAVRIEGISGREAAHRFGIDPRTVAKMLSFSVLPGYRRRVRSWIRLWGGASSLGGHRAFVSDAFYSGPPMHFRSGVDKPRGWSSWIRVGW